MSYYKDEVEVDSLQNLKDIAMSINSELQNLHSKHLFSNFYTDQLEFLLTDIRTGRLDESKVGISRRVEWHMLNSYEENKSKDPKTPFPPALQNNPEYYYPSHKQNTFSPKLKERLSSPSMKPRLANATLKDEYSERRQKTTIPISYKAKQKYPVDSLHKKKKRSKDRDKMHVEKTIDSKMREKKIFVNVSPSPKHRLRKVLNPIVSIPPIKECFQPSVNILPYKTPPLNDELNHEKFDLKYSEAKLDNYSKLQNVDNASIHILPLSKQKQPSITLLSNQTQSIAPTNQGIYIYQHSNLSHISEEDSREGLLPEAPSTSPQEKDSLNQISSSVNNGTGSKYENNHNKEEKKTQTLNDEIDLKEDESDYKEVSSYCGIEFSTKRFLDRLEERLGAVLPTFPVTDFSELSTSKINGQKAAEDEVISEIDRSNFKKAPCMPKEAPVEKGVNEIKISANESYEDSFESEDSEEEEVEELKEDRVGSDEKGEEDKKVLEEDHFEKEDYDTRKKLDYKNKKYCYRGSEGNKSMNKETGKEDCGTSLVGREQERLAELKRTSPKMGNSLDDQASSSFSTSSDATEAPSLVISVDDSPSPPILSEVKKDIKSPSRSTKNSPRYSHKPCEVISSPNTNATSSDTTPAPSSLIPVHKELPTLVDKATGMTSSLSSQKQSVSDLEPSESMPSHDFEESPLSVSSGLKPVVEGEDLPLDVAEEDQGTIFSNSLSELGKLNTPRDSSNSYSVIHASDSASPGETILPSIVISDITVSEGEIEFEASISDIHPCDHIDIKFRTKDFGFHPHSPERSILSASEQLQNYGQRHSLVNKETQTRVEDDTPSQIEFDSSFSEGLIPQTPVAKNSPDSSFSEGQLPELRAPPLPAYPAEIRSLLKENETLRNRLSSFTGRFCLDSNKNK